MKVTVKRYDFVNVKVTEHDREIPDQPPSTPLMELLKKRARLKAEREAAK